VRYNDGASWPIMSGHGCIGCSEPGFWDTLTPFEVPLAGRAYATPFGTDTTADVVGQVALGAAAVGIVAHAGVTAVKSSQEQRRAKHQKEQ
jgi:quinone-reactive Ni/Fe-hydrogenase small subunit